MQKVEGSSPFSRFEKGPNGGVWFRMSRFSNKVMSSLHSQAPRSE
jgi:hypothetical protein